MGKQDSSKTRVAPVFDHLLVADPSGRLWLDRLLCLGSRADVVSSIEKGQTLIPGHPRRWGTDEASLQAPAPLLEHLVRNLDPTRVLDSTDTGDVLTKRTALAARDPDTTESALNELRAGKRGREWFVLEGPSRPDALLEGENVVVCIEGKRTEPKCTTETTWMKQRSQLLRHMDAAMHAYPSKRVLGLLIVEGDGDSSSVGPSQFWIDQSEAQYTPTMLSGSLPHRSADERKQIENGVLGVTTWQAVCAEFGMAWPPSPDVS